MSRSRQQSLMSNLIFSGLFVSMGALIFLDSIDVIQLSVVNISTPWWVSAAIGVAVSLAGVIAALSSLRGGYGDHIFFTWTIKTLQLMLLFFFTVPFHWIFLNYGLRIFNPQDGGNDTGNRFAFGIGAIILELFVIIFLYRVYRGKFKK